jgi:hypothetical protein
MKSGRNSPVTSMVFSGMLAGLLLTCGSLYANESANVVKNSSFDREMVLQMAGWNIPVGQAISVDKEEVHGGGNSIKMDGAGKAQSFTYGWHQIPQHKAGQSYKISVWTKTVDADEKSAYINLAQADKDGKWLDGGWVKVNKEANLLANGGTHDWTKYEATIPAESISPTAMWFGFYVQFNSKRGTVYYGDISMSIVGQDVNLLKNSDFKNVNYRFQDWGVIDWSNGKSIFAADKAVKHSGNQSARITSEGKTLWLTQEVTLKPNTDYLLTVWVKGDKIESDKEGAMAMVWQGTGWDKCLASFGPLKGTFDWTNKDAMGRDSITFRTGNETKYMIKLTLYNSKGTVWFDDIAIREKFPAAQSWI